MQPTCSHASVGGCFWLPDRALYPLRSQRFTAGWHPVPQEVPGSNPGKCPTKSALVPTLEGAAVKPAAVNGQAKNGTVLKQSWNGSPCYSRATLPLRHARTGWTTRRGCLRKHKHLA